MRFIFVCSICRDGFIGKKDTEVMTCNGKKTHPEVPMVVCGVENELASDPRVRSVPKARLAVR